jgi:hypothetical protein
MVDGGSPLDVLTREPCKYEVACLSVFGFVLPLVNKQQF